MDKFHISSTNMTLNYLPEYIAEEQGYFKDVDLEVTSYVPANWNQVLVDINNNDAQAALGGIWVPLIYKRRVKSYFAFAKVSSLCPMAVLMKEPIPDFTWSKLEGKKICVSGQNGASPALFLKGVAREGGADISGIIWIPDFTIAMYTELYAGGFCDGMVARSDVVAQMEKQGKGYMVVDLAKVGGIVPWSVYYSTPEFLADPRNIAGRFTLALQRGQTWLNQHSAEDCRELLTRKFPAINTDIELARLKTYKEMGMWTPTVRIGEEELNRWQKFQVQGNVIDELIPYDEIIDSGPFDYARKELGL